MILRRLVAAMIREVVFDDVKGTIANRKEIQSGGKDKRRHYFPTNVVTAHLLNKEKDEAKEYVSFENMINNKMNTLKSKKEDERRKLCILPDSG
ncbi:hypothetical protein Tco_0829878 [Tanacetum coccineum]